MWIKDFTWNTDRTNIHAHHLARCIVINQWNFPSLRITCLLIINNSSTFSKFVGVRAALWFIPDYQKHRRRPCELKMERKCYIAEAFTQRSINVLAHSAENQKTDQLLYKTATKTWSQKWKRFLKTQKLYQPTAALPPAGVTAGNGNNSGQVLAGLGETIAKP